ncbi:MAG TPA: hypothetical protein VGP94_09735 [Tepidisphaeraceae bacterium]|nr:hypothetical protein [Tepidisphaeraceae bacterium]
MARYLESCLHRLIESLEQRWLFSQGAQVIWNVSFDDPGGAWSAYYNDITRNLQAAAREWGRLFDSNASIEIQVKFDPNVTRAGGGSATTVFLRNTNGLNIFEQGATNEIQTGIDPNGGQPDIILWLQNSYLTDNLWFDPDPASRTAPIPPNRTDAVTVFMHELGHALAFNGWRDWTTGALPGNYASTWDERLYKGPAQYWFFGGANARAVYGSDPPLTYANIHHFGNFSPGPGSDLEYQLMNGMVFHWQYRYDINNLEVAVLKDIGIRLETHPPAVSSKQFIFNTAQRIQIQFDESVRGSLSLSDFTLTRTGPGTPSTIPNSNLKLDYARATNTATISFLNMPKTGLPSGNYELVIHHSGITDLAGNVMAADDKLDFFTLIGDLNRDRAVSISDFITLAANFNKTNATYSDGDLNYDGLVSISDFIDLSSNFNNTVPAPTTPQASLALAPAWQLDSIQSTIQL